MAAYSHRSGAAPDDSPARGDAASGDSVRDDVIRSGAAAPDGPARVLALLVAVQHGLFVLLLMVTTGVALRSGAGPLPVAAGVALIVVWYAAGLRLGARSPGAWQPRWGAWWLVGLAGCWLVLVTVSPAFVWLGFALWLLAAHFLSLPWASVFVVVTVGVVVGAPILHGQEFSVAGVIGPTVGAVFALALSQGEHRLVRDSMERDALVRSLVRAQAEAEELHAELASAQRESGVLAERTRLSRDIHDTLAQGFSSIVLLARAGRLGDDAAVRDTLARIEETASSNLEEARRVVGALAPRDLADGGGLAAALRRQLAGLAADGIGTDLRVDGDVASLPTSLEVALLRTAQGALANVRSHARAGQVVVTIARTDDSVLLDVVDDGAGFDSRHWARRTGPVSRGGYGLQASRTRLRELGGDLEVSSTPGAGTALSAWLPLGPPRGGEAGS